jgi:hypothetical protein
VSWGKSEVALPSGPTTALASLRAGGFCLSLDKVEENNAYLPNLTPTSHHLMDVQIFKTAAFLFISSTQSIDK